MPWGWISREHHEEVVAGKDALIRSLEVQNVILAARLAEPIAVTVELPEDFAVIQPAFIRRKRPKPEGEIPAERAPVDWANVDENDLVRIAELAAAELGSGATPYAKAQCVGRIRASIRRAKLNRRTHSQASGSVGVIEHPEPTVPAHVAAMIEEAERG